MNASRALPPWLLVLTRVFLGCSFLFSDHGNGPNELTQFLAFAMKAGFPWYRTFLAAAVLPNTHLFGTLVVIAETAIGTLLILGLTTRLAGVVAIFLLINYECAKGSLPWTPGIDQAEIVLALIVIVGAAGRVFGLDALLHKRFEKVPLW